MAAGRIEQLPPFVWTIRSRGGTSISTGRVWATTNMFLRGHRIRLEMASSNPRFDRNSPHRRRPDHRTADRYRPAINRILHETDDPSHLILPIIER